MLALVLLAAGCPSGVKESAAPADTGDSAADTAPPDTGDSQPPPDTDGDGYADEDDCAPADPTVNPAVVEACNGVDDDCDGEVDDGLLVSTYADADGDTHGDPAAPVQACPGTGGTSDLADDCDDTEPLAYPGNTESCGDGIDNDCSGGTEDCRWSGTHDLDDVGHWIDAETDTDKAGTSLAALGDVDGDGVDDFMVGAPGHGVVEDDYSDRGAVYVVRGSESGLVDNLGDAWAIIDGVDADGGVGTRLDCSVTGSCTSYSNANGAVRVYSGPVTGTVGWDDWSAELLGEAEGDLAAMNWPSVGDTNGDGYADVALAASGWEGADTGESGAVYLVLGPVVGSGSLGDAGARVVGDAGGGGAAYAGWSTPGLGDVDGDGCADIAISSRLDALGDLPALHVLFGPISSGTVVASGPSFTSTRDGAYPGVHALGDIDGDGLADAAMGLASYEWSAAWPDVPAGGLHVLLGQGI